MKLGMAILAILGCLILIVVFGFATIWAEDCELKIALTLFSVFLIATVITMFVILTKIIFMFT